MDKIKDMMHGGHKEGEHTTPTTTGGYGNEAGTGGQHEKKGMFGLGGHKKEGEEGEKKQGFMGMGGGDSSSSSSDEEREGAAERNRLRRERRAQRQQAGVGTTGVTTAVPQ